MKDSVEMKTTIHEGVRFGTNQFETKMSFLRISIEVFQIITVPMLSVVKNI